MDPSTLLSLHEDASVRMLKFESLVIVQAENRTLYFIEKIGEWNNCSTRLRLRDGRYTLSFVDSDRWTDGV